MSKIKKQNSVIEYIQRILSYSDNENTIQYNHQRRIFGKTMYTCIFKNVYTIQFNMPTSIHSLLISLKITSSKLENILINCILWTMYKRRKEGNLSPGSESVSYVMRDIGKNGKGRTNEGIEKCSLDSLTFLLHSFILAPMLHRPEGPGSDAHHCLNLGISFSWPVSRS